MSPLKKSLLLLFVLSLPFIYHAGLSAAQNYKPDAVSAVVVSTNDTVKSIYQKVTGKYKRESIQITLGDKSFGEVQVRMFLLIKTYPGDVMEVTIIYLPSCLSKFSTLQESRLVAKRMFFNSQNGNYLRQKVVGQQFKKNPNQCEPVAPLESLVPLENVKEVELMDVSKFIEAVDQAL